MRACAEHDDFASVLLGEGLEFALIIGFATTLGLVLRENVAVLDAVLVIHTWIDYWRGRFLGGYASKEYV